MPVWRPAFQSGAPGAGGEPDSGSPPAAPPPHARCRHRGATFLSRRRSAGRRPRPGTPVSRPARAVLRTAHGATPIRGDDPSLGVNLSGRGRDACRSTRAGWRGAVRGPEGRWCRSGDRRSYRFHSAHTGDFLLLRAVANPPGAPWRSQCQSAPCLDLCPDGWPGWRPRQRVSATECPV